MEDTSNTKSKRSDFTLSNDYDEEDNDYSDMFNSSLTCCDCDSNSSEYKKFKAKKIKTLKSLIGYLDNPKHRSCDFQIPSDLYKELVEIIKSLFSIKCKAQNLFNSIINPSCTNRRNNNNLDVVYRQLKMILENGLQEIERYTDKIIEIMNAIADNYMNRLCLVMAKIQKTHCRGLIPIPLLIKDMKFVYTLVELLNQKLEQPGEISETLSGKEQLFGGACCVDINQDKCPINENECSDVNELILKKVINKDFDYNILNLSLKGNYIHPNLKYCHSLVQQYNFLNSMDDDFVAQIHTMGVRAGFPVFTPIPATPQFIEINPHLTPAQIQNIVINERSSEAPDLNAGQQLTQARLSQTYRKVRDSMLYHFKKLAGMDKFITKKMPTILPCTFFGREQMNEKALLVYIELSRFSKYLVSILILRSIALELKHEPAGAGVPPPFNPPANCKSVKDNFYRNPAQHNLCLNGAPPNIRYVFMHRIYQDMFGAFANDPRIAAA